MTARELYTLYRTGWIAGASSHVFDPKGDALPTNGRKAYSEGYHDGYKARMSAMEAASKKYKCEVLEIHLLHTGA